VAVTGRLDGVDLARAVALVGMMLVHVVMTIDWRTGDPSVAGMLAGGRAAPLFALLAGLSLTLVRTRDPDGAGSSQAVVVRSAVLVVLGLLLGSLESATVLVILTFYGAMLVVLLPFLRLPTRTLGLVAAGWLLLAPVVHLLLLRVLGADYQGQLEVDDLRAPGSFVAELSVTGSYPALVWTGYLLAGAWLGRLPLERVRVAVGLVAAGTALLVGALAAGLLVLRSGVLDGLVRDTSWRGLFTSAGSMDGVTDTERLLVVGEHTSSSLNVLSATGSAVLLLGLCLLLVHVAPARTAVAPLLAAGSMPLTMYTLHVLWTWSENAHGWRMADDRHVEWASQVVVLVVAAWLWRRTWGRGPLEQAVRVLSLPRR
jgi:uncharacterized membrane protein YeiB